MDGLDGVDGPVVSVKRRLSFGPVCCLVGVWEGFQDCSCREGPIRVEVLFGPVFVFRGYVAPAGRLVNVLVADPEREDDFRAGSSA